MANPTAKVPAAYVPVTEEFMYWPTDSTVDTKFYTDEMLGIRLSDGLATHFDDTVPMIFLGLVQGPTQTRRTTDPTPAQVRVRSTMARFSMPLSTGSGTRPTDIGKPVYAADAGHVTLDPSALVVVNVAGYVFDPHVAKPVDLTGIGSVWVVPPEKPRQGSGVYPLTPTALSGSVNDYSPTGFQWASMLRISGGGAARNITGLAAGVHGQSVILVNLSTTATEDLVLKHQSGSSAAANRFIGANAADVTVRAGGAVRLVYDGVTSRWRPLAI